MLIQESRSMFPPLQLTVYHCQFCEVRSRTGALVARPSWRLYWYPDGGAGVQFRNSSHFPSPEELLVIPPHTPIRHLSLRPCPHFYIHAKLGQPCDSFSGKIFKVRVDALMEDLILKLRDSEAQPNIRLLRACSLITMVLACLPEDIWPERPQDPRLLKVLELFNSSPGHKYRQQDMARTAGLSRNAFARLFKTQTSMSPNTYLIKSRLNQACEMLLYSEKSMDEIAALCGFRDRNYMSRVFKAKLGTSPGLYRRSGLASENH
ncbi:MAG: helix-turn-helix transcriptional regulator [Victivallales bacterium]|nr:helix-turn-helix transcriptional regulator [Victivallales bacterium]